jgi:hypothetical protein
MILNNFNSYKIEIFLDSIIIKFLNFKSNKLYSNNYITNLIKSIEKYESLQFSIDDIMTCLNSNMFYYKREDNIITGSTGSTNNLNTFTIDGTGNVSCVGALNITSTTTILLTALSVL